ncbi:type VI secretion system baseplate subunit TssG [Methylomarinum vadi]|uniref:type VI secretion system baseplate subunit TssG n=1 Tax=Methylomarinum vadi TaxID=438855 RepID=UPI0004DFAF0C|nr:type VI secretion system baseplate subunit TssG [Methylomarinum vadi]
MAGQNRHPNFDLEPLDQLRQAPYKFDFYQALRLMECLNKKKPRLGYSAKPADDLVRLGQKPSMQFAPSMLASFKLDGKRAAVLKVFFFGVFGPNGPLPLHLTEYARSRIRHAKDETFAEFADLFHHRLLSLFYRAWADKEPTVQLDRPDHDRFSFYVGSLTGMAEPSLRKRDEISDHTKLHFAAHLACHCRHAEGLQVILQDYFQVPVRLDEFVGEWLDMPADSYCFLDQDETTGQLGVSTVIGTRSWQCQHKFRITIGPLTLEQYEKMLPNGENLTKLHGLVRNYVGFELTWDVNLVLKAAEVPSLQLGGHGRLGWTSWLQAGKRQQAVNDLFLNMERMV